MAANNINSSGIGFCLSFDCLQRLACHAPFWLCAVNQQRKVFFAKCCVGVVVVDLQPFVDCLLLTINNKSFFPSVKVNQIIVLATTGSSQNKIFR